MAGQQFIKKNGKIVPLSAYQKKGMQKPPMQPQQTQKPAPKPPPVKEALKFVGAGVAVSGLTHFAAGKFLKKAVTVGEKVKSTVQTAKAISQSGHLTSTGQKATTAMIKTAGKQAKTVGALATASKGLVFTGHALGGALIGAGLNKLYEKATGRKSTATEQLATTGAGLAAVAVGNYAFRKGLGNGNIRKILGKMVR